ncbi:MAG: 2,5-diketo-D-gluconate reductase A [Promethearchaeota archaeon]|nr:MAG: 2,5-diketo-D-gluconate reductase A [Candidatus Lokiarchaeota archaeon]
MNENNGFTYELNNGIKIPSIGFGTWALNGKTAQKAVKWALKAGYRLIDTASMYGNEVEIGKAIKESSIKREELFITTKIWDSEQGYENTFKAFERSLARLQVDYIDLYLIHWPRTKRLETWRAMEELYKQDNKVVRAIGVSNFTIDHLNELLRNSTIKPVINQVEFSPFLYQKDLLSYCNIHEIKVEAYAPLTRTEKFDNATLQEISKKYGKTVPQILIRWGLEHGLVEIPKSSNKEHIFENIDVFEFSIEDEDLKVLDSLNQDFRTVNDPIF